MLNLERKNSLESLDSKLSPYNSLDVDNCLFTPELLATILRSNKSKSTYSKHLNNKHSKVYNRMNGMYLIAFRVLNKEKKSLVYNYIYYNDMLYLTLIVYFLVRNIFITENNHEWGKYLVVLDNKFLNYDLVDKYLYLHTKNKARY